MISQTLISLFASAGGGGSSSGEGAGLLTFLIGYGPMHVWGASVRRKYRGKDEDKFAALQVMVWIFGIIYALIWLILSLFAIGNSFIVFLYLFAPAIGAVLGTGAGLYNWFGKVKQSQQVKTALQQSAAKDASWDETRLTNGAKNVFLAFQRDWSQNNAAATAAYLTPYYRGHIELMITALQQMGRQNNVVDPEISELQIVSTRDSDDDSQDAFTAGFEFRANDQLIDLSTNQIIFTNKRTVAEFWDFYRDGDSWRLGGIRPSTEAEWVRSAPLQQFAQSNGFYYSLDWGWLLLPQRGQLFGAGAFGTSDINNHCIGWFQGTYDRILTQIYTYAINPDFPNAYLIAQATLPRSYGNIVVRRRKGLFQFKIKGLREVSTEWQDFNKMYQVFATSSEQATSFELLNPKYMEQLAAAPFEINIEVVDNVLYLYAPLTGKGGKKMQPKTPYDYSDLTNKYQMLLWALAAAFKEMKM